MFSDQLKNDIVITLQESLQPAFILLFGSYARGEAREDSDIDIAYYSKKSLSHYERFILAGELATICDKEVDLVDLKEVDTVFAAQIFSTGELLDCTDENEFIKQRMKAYSMYVTLNEQRAKILQDIQERGSVFGE